MSGIEPDYQVPGTERWAETTIRWCFNTVRAIAGEAKPLVSHLPHLRAYAEGQGRSWDEFCRAELKTEPAWVAKIEEGVQILIARGRPNPTVGQAVTAAEAVRATMAAAEPTKPVGGKRAGAGRKPTEHGPDNQDSATTLIQPTRVRDASYLAGRIKAKALTDARAADVAARVERGEYPSMRAAARDAGVLKPPDPVRVALRALEKVPSERLAELAAGLPENTRDALRTVLNHAPSRPQ